MTALQIYLAQTITKFSSRFMLFYGTIGVLRHLASSCL